MWFLEGSTAAGWSSLSAVKHGSLLTRPWLTPTVWGKEAQINHEPFFWCILLTAVHQGCGLCVADLYSLASSIMEPSMGWSRDCGWDGKQICFLSWMHCDGSTMSCTQPHTLMIHKQHYSKQSQLWCVHVDQDVPTYSNQGVSGVLLPRDYELLTRLCCPLPHTAGFTVTYSLTCSTPLVSGVTK